MYQTNKAQEISPNAIASFTKNEQIIKWKITYTTYLYIFKMHTLFIQHRILLLGTTEKKKTLK